MGIAPTEQRGPASDRGVASPAGDRWVGVGHADDSDPADAGARACADALGGRAAKLLIVFASDSYDLQALLRGVRSQGADAALVGCTTAGQISRAGAGDEGVVVTALGGEGFEVRTAVAALDGAPPQGVIAFDCIGRRGVLGEDRIAEEVAAIAACAGEAPFAGLYTYGEVARVRGVNALHSQTFVAMAIG